MPLSHGGANVAYHSGSTKLDNIPRSSLYGSTFWNAEGADRANSFGAFDSVLGLEETLGLGGLKGSAQTDFVDRAHA